jgi:hypothetical protein
MNEHDLLDAIGKTEETVLEASEKRHIPWKFLLTAAACLVLLLSTVTNLILPAFDAATALPGQTISAEKITWLRNSNILGASPSSNAMITGEYFYDNQFSFQMSVEARVLDVLPHKYQIPAGHSNHYKYRILRMELVDTIYGQNMPSRFYYLLPEELSTDLKQFDSLILTLEQLGYEDYMLRNANRGRMETFSFLFHSGYCEPDRGAVIALTDGKVDMTLWQLEGWKNWEGWPEALADAERYPEYPGKTNRSIPQIKEAIRQGVAKYQQKGSYHTRSSVMRNEDLNWPEAQAMLEQIKPFENGYYGSSTTGNSSNRSISYRRFVNGFGTNEYISIDPETQSVRTSNLFTEKDLRNLPQLDLLMATASWREAPKPWSSKAEPYEFCGVSGEYQKEGDTIFGIVTIYWGYPDIEESERISCCIVRKVQQKSYLLVYPNGKTVPAKNRTELDQLIAEYTG